MAELELLWRKTGRGSFRLKNGKIIKPGERFKALRSDIPTAFLDVIECISTEEEKAAIALAEEKEVKKDAGEELYELKEIEGKQYWFDVVNKTDGKVINEKPMRKKAALELIETLKG